MDTLKIQRALIAVYDKTGIADFARALVDEFGIEIISTGGTAKHLKEAGIPVTMVEQVTGFPEMLDGRVKTLHPKIHAAILADRDNPDHMRQLAEHGIQPIDMVVVNLYPFEKTVADPNCKFEDAIEMIDIGGPCMLRAAAKNHSGVLVACLRQQYKDVLDALRACTGCCGYGFRLACAINVFETTSGYDLAVYQHFSSFFGHMLQRLAERRGDSGPPVPPPAHAIVALSRDHLLRYGENPAQDAALWSFRSVFGMGATPSAPDQGAMHARLGREATQVHSEQEATLVWSEQVSESPLSFNNYVDGDAALSLVKELTRAAKEPRASARAVPGSSANADSPSNEPRASARAVGLPADAFSPPDSSIRKWLLTWTTYGQWLPGDPRGFVSRTPTDQGAHIVHNVPGTPYSAAERDVSESARERMGGEPVLLSSEQALCAFEALIDVAHRHGIGLLALSVMSNHVHLLCQTERQGDELLQLFKGSTSRELGKRFALPAGSRWWTKSGSTRHIKAQEDVCAAVDYVLGQQGMLCGGSFRGAVISGVEGGRGVSRLPMTARAEARGSLGGASLTSGCAVAFIKHTNACGCAVGDDPIDTYRRAYLGDPIAAAGGVLCVNFAVTRDFAQTVMNTFQAWGKAAGASFFKLDVWIAPGFDDDAVDLITTPTEKRKWGASCRLLAVGDMSAPPDPNDLDYRKIAGGMLVQTRDLLGLNEDEWKVVTQRAPSESEMSDLRFAWLVCKHTKSNAISICRDGMLLGNGAGQMSRVKSCDVAIQLAHENGHGDKLAGAVAAGDAFFPVPDGPAKLIAAGITAMIQPGGGKRDAETIAACDQAGVAMILTGTRHFKH